VQYKLAAMVHVISILRDYCTEVREDMVRTPRLRAALMVASCAVL
jgi:hypothetical protein